MKKLFILLAILLLTGCATDCSFIMNQDGITSRCTIAVTNEEIYDNKVSEGKDNPKLHEFLSKTILMVYKNGNDEKYIYRSDRETLAGNRYSGSYTYNYNNFKYSTLFDCVENKEYRFNGKEVYLRLSGKNICNSNSALNVSVQIPFNIKEINAHKVNDDFYLWNFKYGEDIDILINIGEDAVAEYKEKIENEEELHKNISVGLIVGGIVIVFLAIVIIKLKRKKKNAI